MSEPNNSDSQIPLVTTCCSWLITHLDSFAVDWDADTSDIFRKLKPYAELAFIASIEQTTGIDQLIELRSLVTDWMANNEPNPDVIERVVWEFPQSYPWVGMLCQNRARLFMCEAKLLDTLGRLSRRRCISNFERPVGHEIAVYNFCESLSLDTNYTLEELYSRTMFAHAAWDNPSDTSLYFICHDIFFLSDWGKRSIPCTLIVRDSWLRHLNLWHRDRAIAGQVDLAAELWLARSFLQMTHNRDLDQPTEVKTDLVGLPCFPRGQGAGFRTPGQSTDLISFYERYHTVLVCLLALGRGWPGELRDESA
jgi:hypothetical protein